MERSTVRPCVAAPVFWKNQRISSVPKIRFPFTPLVASERSSADFSAKGAPETFPQRTACGYDAPAMLPTCSVLLDLDGTLIDSQPGILASCRAALCALGHEPDETLDIKSAIGPPLEDLLHVLLQRYGDDRVSEAVAACRQHYGEIGLFGSEPYPGIANSLKQLQQAGLRIYLATSKRAVFARRILEHLGFAPYFDGIHGCGAGRRT